MYDLQNTIGPLVGRLVGLIPETTLVSKLDTGLMLLSTLDTDLTRRPSIAETIHNHHGGDGGRSPPRVGVRARARVKVGTRVRNGIRLRIGFDVGRLN